MFKFSFLSLITLFLSISVILALPLDRRGTELPTKQGPSRTPPPQAGRSASGTFYDRERGVESWGREYVVTPQGYTDLANVYPKNWQGATVAFALTPDPNQPSTSQQPKKKGFFGKIKSWIQNKLGKKDKGKGRGKQCRFAFRELKQG